MKTSKRKREHNHAVAKQCSERNLDVMRKRVHAEFTPREWDTVLAALRLWQAAADQESAGAVEIESEQYEALVDISCEHDDALTVGDIEKLVERINCSPEPQGMGVVVEVSGGVVQEVHGVSEYTLMDWDNLLGDGVNDEEIADGWTRLSNDVQAFIKKERSDEYKKIHNAVTRYKRAQRTQTGRIQLPKGKTANERAKDGVK